MAAEHAPEAEASGAGNATGAGAAPSTGARPPSSEAAGAGGETLQVIDTELTADCVESCPPHGRPDVVVLGTYQLNKEDGTKAGQLRPHLLEPASSGDGGGDEGGGDSSADSTAAGPSLKQLQCINTAGLLDAKWAQAPVGDQCLLGIATTKAMTVVYALDAESGCLSAEPVASHIDEDDPDLICLSLDWDNRVSRSSADVHMVVSQSNSNVSTFVVAPDRLERTLTWRAHEFMPGADIEVWIAAFNYWEPSTVYTGGDDCVMKGWDLRTGCLRPTFVSRDHTAGVCSMHSHPHREHVFASGSYDESVRLWDTRSMRAPVAAFETGGGVWRLKWFPGAEHANLLLAACMHNGFQVLDVAGGSGGTRSADAGGDTTEGAAPLAGDVSRLAHYTAQKSLAYGVDWCYAPWSLASSKPLVASCSFYDKLFHLWRPLASLWDGVGS